MAQDGSRMIVADEDLIEKLFDTVGETHRDVAFTGFVPQYLFSRPDLANSLNAAGIVISEPLDPYQETEEETGQRLNKLNEAISNFENNRPLNTGFEEKREAEILRRKELKGELVSEFMMGFTDFLIERVSFANGDELGEYLEQNPGLMREYLYSGSAMGLLREVGPENRELIYSEFPELKDAWYELMDGERLQREKEQKKILEVGKE